MGAALSRDSIRSRVETSNVRTNGWRGRRRAGERDDGEAVRARDEARRRARACVRRRRRRRSVGRSVGRSRAFGMVGTARTLALAWMVLVTMMMTTVRGQETTTTTTTTTTSEGPFSRALDYPYRVCDAQVGEYATLQEDGTTANRARCVSLDAGELGFCQGIAYDACVRTDPPTTQDKKVLAMFERMTKHQAAIAPMLAGDPACLLVMAEYMCAAAFPRCDPDPVELTKYYEIPMCWEYCMNSVYGCTGEMASAQKICNASLATGVVVPSDRPDVKCTSASRLNQRVVVAAAASLVVVIFVI